MTFAKYDEMKDSEIEWVGEIPEHWHVKRLKFQIKMNEKNLNEKIDPSLEISYIDVGSVHTGGQIDEPEKMSFESAPSRARRIVKLNDTIVSTVRTYLKAIAFIDETKRNCICSTGFAVLSPKSLDPKFLFRAVSSQNFVDDIEANSVGVTYPSINSSELGNLQIICPPNKKEQKQIASYLDKKTTEIDAEIEKNQKLILLLKEQKQSSINYAVTKGLDDTVPMKDSGIIGIKKIPENWGKKKLKFVSRIFGRIGFRGYTVNDIVNEGEGAITLSPSNIFEDTFNLDNKTYLSWAKYEESPEIQIFENDILLVKTGSTIGKVCIVDNESEKMTINPQLIVLKSLMILPKFLIYFMRSDNFKDQIYCDIVGGSTPTVSQEKIFNYYIVSPTIKEQKQIAEYLDKKTSKIDSLISKVELQIKQLQEFRESLISSAVTGKIKVTA